MKRFSMVLALAMSAMLLLSKNAPAQQRTQSRYTNQNALQAKAERIESLEASLARHESGGEIIFEGDQMEYSGCDSCGGGSCGGDCGGCAIYAGAEIVYAKPYFEDETEVDSNESEYDYEASARLIGGFRNASGLGARIRYWRWDHDSEEDLTSEDPFHLDVQALDTELTKMFSLGAIDAMLFGGLRYGKVSHKDNDDQGMTFEGVGPTVGVDLMVPINCTNLALLGGFRYSALFGDSRFTTTDDRGQNDVVSGVDVQLGVQYSICCAHGNINLKALVESQVWEGATSDPTNELDDITSTDEDLGFLGFGLGLEYVF